MSDQYSLRKATEKDFPFFRELHRLLFRKHIEQIWGWDQDDQEQRTREAFENDVVQVIQVDNQDIGFLQVEDQEDCVRVGEIWIAPDYQNRGIGTAIVNDVIQKAFQVSKGVFLGVLRTNHRAKAFYKRLGFIVYEDDGDRFLMKKLLEEAP